MQFILDVHSYITMVRQFFIFILISIAAFPACAQGKYKSTNSKDLIDIQSVRYVEILTNSSKEDSLLHVRIRLSDQQVKVFVDKWNDAKPKGLWKFIIQYEVEVVLENGKTRNFRINGSKVKEKGDLCFDMGSMKFLESLMEQNK